MVAACVDVDVIACVIVEEAAGTIVVDIVLVTGTVVAVVDGGGCKVVQTAEVCEPVLLKTSRSPETESSNKTIKHFSHQGCIST